MKRQKTFLITTAISFVLIFSGFSSAIMTWTDSVLAKIVECYTEESRSGTLYFCDYETNEKFISISLQRQLWKETKTRIGTMTKIEIGQSPLFIFSFVIGVLGCVGFISSLIILFTERDSKVYSASSLRPKI